MRFSATSLLTLALPLAYTGVAAAASSAETFLAANPDIAVGREALEKGQASLGPNTFGLVNKPADGVVLLQEFDGETHERVLAVALVDDEKAEQYYRENNRDGDAKGKVMKRFDATGAQDNCPRAVDAAEPDADPAMSDQTTAEAFLAAHPEVLVGRAALDQAERDAGDDTFSIVNKPLANVVLVQHFHPDTLERLFAVALVDDQRAEDYYKRQNQDGDADDEEEDAKGCPKCGAGKARAAVHGPDRFLYRRMETCREACPNAQVGQMWPA
ncbi:hypothetical protein HIM_06849 [Hirsutella minnesotensis 3608]|uniref:Uncharacterized protein n=1 Tax=Hirsutella minnesotensis 3608 TaxID=1043627 RepID=A0A0F7ZII7_9HYPO|nr:hypothetical protein HIM_06849 [Hirsutella minnesotensis 3608]